jgi:hypothetical protein
LKYIVRYLSAGEMATDQVEARDAASAVATVKQNRDQTPAFEPLSVLLISTTACAAESIAVS